MNVNILRNNIEALLYFYNEPISYKKIADILDVDIDKIEKEILDLQEELLERGLRLITSDSEAQLVAFIDSPEVLEKLDESRSEAQFTPAVLETLAIALYLDKVTEAKIDAIRGVRSSRTIKKLCRRGYLQEVSGVYSLSADAKRQLGIAQLSDIPNFDSTKLKLEELTVEGND